MHFQPHNLTFTSHGLRLPRASGGAEAGKGGVEPAGMGVISSGGSAELFRMRTSFRAGMAQREKGAATAAKGCVTFAKGMNVFAMGKATFSKGMATFVVGKVPFSKGMATFAVGKAAFSKGMATFGKGKVPFSKGMTTFVMGKATFSKDMATFGKGKACFGRKKAPFQRFCALDDGFERRVPGSRRRKAVVIAPARPPSATDLRPQLRTAHPA